MIYVIESLMKLRSFPEIILEMLYQDFTIDCNCQTINILKINP